jgi:phosphotransferase system enzyme I (PtsI)
MPKAHTKEEATSERIELKGIAVSPGRAIGKALVLTTSTMKIEPRKIADDLIAEEVERFHKAVEISKEQIRAIREKVEREIDSTHAAIFGSHLLILEDPLIIDETIRKIHQLGVNAEYAFSETMDRISSLFSRIAEGYFSARDSDVTDVRNRVLGNILQLESIKLSDLGEPVIVIARDLGPSDTAHMSRDKVMAFATDIGGPTSHTAIMAKALEIPAVVGLDSITRQVQTNDTVIVDGTRGIVIVNPLKADLDRYARDKKEQVGKEKELEKLCALAAETLDGHRVELSANIELPSEIGHVKHHGADGIGLFRTEFIYLDKDHLPTEEEQFDVYREVASSVRPKPVIFRTLDLGGDKFLSAIPLSKELNILGLRAIRLCLAYPDMFRQQLRAMLRASANGFVKIMFPFVTALEELLEAKKILADVMRDLKKRRVPFDAHIEVGIMIEIPSAALIADRLAKEVNFFSIGTNDLIQYTLAVDRVNERVAHLYEPLHPGVLRLIKSVVDAGHAERIWVGVCGEMAADPVIATILLGLGVDELSMGPVSIPEVKKVIRSIRMDDARRLASVILSQENIADIKKIVHAEFCQLEQKQAQ